MFQVGKVVWLRILLLLEFDPKLDYRTRNAMNNMFYANAAKVSMTNTNKMNKDLSIVVSFNFIHPSNQVLKV